MAESLFPDPRDAIRDVFKRSFREYTEESAKLQKMLLALSEQPPEVRGAAIEAQQNRVNEARERYHSARDQYIRHVLEVEGLI
jgi:hypothetical protein